jgi:ribosomal protein S18 acetylase RimI-like enzyme
MNTDQIIIRREPFPEDIKTVAEIVRSTGFFREDEISVAVELIEERLAKGLESGYEFLFAEHNGETVAYSCFGLIPCTLKSYDLYWIASHHDFRGMGIGRFLLSITEQEIKRAGGNGIYVETSSKEQYMPTRVFYEKNNYQLKARFEDFYDTNDDKLVYVKYVGESQKP